MLLLGRLVDWVTLIALLASTGLYLTASFRPDAVRDRLARLGRASFVLATAGIISAVAILGTLLVTHRFDSDYVYQHSAKALDPLYWFPSMWAGQEGSFLLWAFWTGILGVVLACTSGRVESRVMPIYNGVLIFLAAMLVIRSPFLPLDTHGMPVPSEGLGLNPNLENPWMVIHPPTLFLGLSSLAAPFSFALMALFWRDWDGWMRRALPWGLFGFALLGLAMMMGGYWAYEMLGWGGFWGWDPVENGPFIPWLFLVGFLHAAQVHRVRRGLMGATLAFALMPFIMGLYETFLTRTGILEKFSVHSFSTLGGVGNDVLLYVLIGSFLVAVSALIWRRKAFQTAVSVWDAPATREFGYLMAVILVTLCAAISTIGMSAPLLTQIGMDLHLTDHVASIKEDFYNHATFPVAVLLTIGMGITPYLTWRREESLIAASQGQEKGAGVDSKLASFYGISVLAAVGLSVVRYKTGSAIFGWQLAGQMLLFASSVFALVANGYLLVGRIARRPSIGRVTTAGGVISHIGAAVLFLGIVCLVTFVRKDPDVLLEQGKTMSVLNGAYSMTYLGQTGDFKTDRNNALKYAVVSSDGREKFTALLPYALRSVEGGGKLLFGHPAIAHHVGGDLYIALKDGPKEMYRTPIYQPAAIPLGSTTQFGPYTIKLVRFERDQDASAFVQQTGRMPENFPVWAVLQVTYQGVTSIVEPELIMHADNPDMPDTPEVKLPAGWLVSFQSMNAGSAVRNAGPSQESAKLMLRGDSGPPAEAFDIEVTTRPMIDLVWLGTLLLVIGGLFSMRQRILENRVATDREAQAESEPRPRRDSSTPQGNRKSGRPRARLGRPAADSPMSVAQVQKSQANLP